MAIAFGAFTNPTAGTGDLTWTHTGGTPAGVFVFAVHNNATADSLTTVTYGALTLTKYAGTPVIHSTGESGVIHFWWAGASIPTGDQTVTCDFSAAGTKQAGCITVTASANVELIDVDLTISSDSQSNPSVTLSLGGRTCFCALALHSGEGDPSLITPLASWTAKLEHDYGNQMMAVYTYDTIGTADVTAGWTQNANDAVMIAIAASEVLAPTQPPRTMHQTAMRM